MSKQVMLHLVNLHAKKRELTVAPCVLQEQLVPTSNSVSSALATVSPGADMMKPATVSLLAMLASVAAVVAQAPRQEKSKIHKHHVRKIKIHNMSIKQQASKHCLIQ